MGKSKSTSKSPSMNIVSQSNVKVSNSSSPSPDRSRSHSKKKKKASSSRSSSTSLDFFNIKGPSKSTLTYLFVSFQFAIFIFLLVAIVSPHYLPKDTQFYSCTYVYEMEENVCYTAKDISCITLLGYKQNCFHRNYTMRPIGCDDRVKMLTSALAITICAFIFSFILFVLSFLFMFNVYRNKTVMLVCAGVTLVLVVVALVLVLVIYVSKMCKAHFFIEDPAYDLTEWSLGPGFAFLIVALVLQIACIVFITYL